MNCVGREARPPIRMLCPCYRRYKTRPPYFILPFFFSSSLLSSSTSSFSLKMKYFKKTSFYSGFLLQDIYRSMTTDRLTTSASRISPTGFQLPQHFNPLSYIKFGIYEYNVLILSSEINNGNQHNNKKRKTHHPPTHNEYKRHARMHYILYYIIPCHRLRTMASRPRSIDRLH